MTDRDAATNIKVGIFVFALLLSGVLAIFFLGGDSALFERSYKLVADFRDISGLRVGAPVQLAGVRVGAVEQIQFSSDPEVKTIRISLTVNRSYQQRIRQDSQATIETQGLLGDKAIAISVGSANQPILEDGSVISSLERPSLFAFANSLNKAASSFGDLFSSIQGKQFGEDVNRSAASISNILKEIETGNGLLHNLIYPSTSKKDRLEVSNTLQNMDQASADLASILKKVNQGDGTLGALVNDASLYYDMRRLLGKVDRNQLLKWIVRSRLKEDRLEMEPVITPQQDDPLPQSVK